MVVARAGRGGAASRARGHGRGPARAGCTNAVIDTTVVTPPTTSTAARGQASLYTVQMSFEIVNTAKLQNAGARVIFSDGRSMQQATAQNRHALNTLTKRALSVMDLPAVPAGVTLQYASLMPPGDPRNPTQGRSWAWIGTAFGDSKPKAAKAIQFLMDYTEALLDQAFFGVDLEVPASDNSGAWSATSTTLSKRLLIKRCGTQVAGGKYNIEDMVNFVFNVSQNAPEKNRKKCLAYHAKHAGIITLSIGTATIAKTSQTSEDTATSATQPRTKASSSRVMKTSTKQAVKNKTKDKKRPAMTKK